MDNNFEEMKEKLEEKTRDSGIFPTLLGLEHIPTESLGAMGSNVSLEEFLKEMKRHGLEISVSPKKKATPPPAPTQEELTRIPLAPEVEDTPENRAHYAQIREKAQKKLQDTSVLQTFLETEKTPQTPVDGAALEDLNTASYLGEYNALRDLSKKLKPDNEEEDS